MSNDKIALIIKPVEHLKVIEDRAEAARQTLFEAQAIINLARNACLAEGGVCVHSMRLSLGVASKMLDDAAERLDVAVLTADEDADQQ
jgi:hypothetical protein